MRRMMLQLLIICSRRLAHGHRSNLRHSDTTHTTTGTSMEQPFQHHLPPPEWKQTDVIDRATGSTFRVNFQGDLPSYASSSSSSSSSDSLPHQVDDQAPDQEEETVLVFLHGAGHTGVSWTLPCIELGTLIGMTHDASPPALLMLAPDLPFHGQTKVVPNDGHMSMKRLVKELLSCLKACLQVDEEGEEGRKRRRSLTLVGHSVGGACAIRLAQEPGLAALGTLKGICVVDMVEGAAMASLSHMHDKLREVPQSFESVEAAIEWSLGAGHVLKNEKSAALSVPAQLRKVRGRRRRREGEEGNGDAAAAAAEGGGGEGGGEGGTTTNEDDEQQLEEEYHYEWITDLRATEPFWQDWFQGLSSAFLSPSLHPTPKLLVLANYSLLECDRAICAAQMQGMFEMQFMQGGGHALMEDFPLHFARTLYRFLRRNRIVKEGEMEGGREGGRRDCASPVCGQQQQQQQQQQRSRSESPAHHPLLARYQQPHQHHHSHTHQYRSVSPSSSTSSSSSSSSSASSHMMHGSNHSNNNSSSSSSSSSSNTTGSG